MKKVVIGTVLAAVLVALGFWIFGGGSNHKTHKATCWSLLYAREHNPNHLFPAPRHGKGSDPSWKLCYTAEQIKDLK